MTTKNRNQDRLQQGSQNEREDRLTFEGVVEEVLPSTLFRVKCENFTPLCTLAGKLRVNRIRILAGDKVTVEVSPYDVSRGRIVWRGR